MKKVLAGTIALAIVSLPLFAVNASKYENKMRSSEPVVRTDSTKKADDTRMTCPRMKEGRCPCIKNGECICGEGKKCPCMKDGKCPCIKDGKCTCTKERCNCIGDQDRAQKKHKRHHKKQPVTK